MTRDVRVMYIMFVSRWEGGSATGSNNVLEEDNTISDLSKVVLRNIFDCPQNVISFKNQSRHDVIIHHRLPGRPRVKVTLQTGKNGKSLKALESRRNQGMARFLTQREGSGWQVASASIRSTANGKGARRRRSTNSSRP